MNRQQVEQIARETAGTPVGQAMVETLKMSVTDEAHKYTDENLQNMRDALVIFNTVQGG
jgi:division protein CdvB (Snf7/Vps24/ESCRT-III family)